MTTPSDTPAPRGLGWSAHLYAATFFLGAALHAGFELPLGFTVLREPAILQATIVAIRFGPGTGSSTALNDAYHVVMLVALSLSLGLLIGRRRLAAPGHAQPATNLPR